MPVRRRRDKRREEIPADVIAFLSDEEGWEPATPYFTPSKRMEEYWRAARDEILAAWAKHSPGRRPSAWWSYESKAPRRRLGGIGDAIDQDYDYWPKSCDHGLPVQWVQQWLVDYWNRRNAERGEPPTDLQAIDPAFPPLFESQASYLKRLNLLLPGEERQLTPKDFEPEAIAPEPEDEEQAD